MPNLRRMARLNHDERIRMFFEHHVSAIRFKKGGIQELKHVTLGWIKPEQYYALEKAHEFLPVLEKIVEGGYRAQAAIIGFNPEVRVEAAGFGATIPLPFGASLLGAALLDLLVAVAIQDPLRMLKAMFKVAGPFGLILQAYESLAGAAGAVEVIRHEVDTVSMIAKVTPPILQPPPRFGP